MQTASGKGKGNVWTQTQVEEADFGLCVGQIEINVGIIQWNLLGYWAVVQNTPKMVSTSLERDKLCKFYVIWNLDWKLHKKTNALGVRNRTLAGQISQILHCQLRDAVLSHEFVLKDSISFFHQLKCMYIFRTQDVILKSADVAALEPLINLENGLTAMRWFMEQHASIPFG